MKFVPDPRYISIQSLKATVYYLIGIVFCDLLLHTPDMPSFIVMTLIMAIVMFIVFFYPGNYYVCDGQLIFRVRNGVGKKKIKLNNIKDVKVQCGLYKTVDVITNYGEIFKLHPKDAESFQRIIISQKESRLPIPNSV